MERQGAQIAETTSVDEVLERKNNLDVIIILRFATLDPG
jgi:hypothetical protein